MSYTTPPLQSQTAAGGGPAPDPWADQDWTIVAVEQALIGALSAAALNGGPARFRLQLVSSNGKPAYQVKPAGSSALPGFFSEGAVFFPTGKQPLDCLPDGPLPRFVQDDAGVLGRYWKASSYVLSAAESCNEACSRLQGTVTWLGTPHTVRLYQVEGGITNDVSLLVVDVQEDDPTSSPDGSAIGHN